MKAVLIVGSGGREHAIARAFAKSSKVKQVFVAPGNAGMCSERNNQQAPIDIVPLPMNDIEALAKFAQDEVIDITFVGSELPLELGIVDLFQQKGLSIVGPTQEAAQLESSKNYAKAIMHQAGVKTAKHQYFPATEHVNALDYVHQLGLPLVIKADGLMAGKGVVIPESIEEAEETLEEMMLENHIPVLMEEFLVGPEFSHFSLINGEHIIPLGTACDYKRVNDNDTGLNTGGMGAFAPVPWFDAPLEKQVMEDIVSPIAKQMVANGTPFTGVLYTGLMLTKEGPKVIEFNTRLGDPETQILLPLIENDFTEVVEAHLNQEEIAIRLTPSFNLGVVLAAEGYPKDCQKGMPISIPESLAEQIYYAGVGESNQGQLIANGGRILMGTANGESLLDAHQNAYDLMRQINVPKTFYRTDIGLKREREN